MTKTEKMGNLYFSKSRNLRVKISVVTSSGISICRDRNNKYYKTRIEDLVKLY